ncbi:MAG TPA: hypothetical protein VHU62_13835 [Mycobacterium sp.]|jgi:hypothetical protein|nr:hypothetical protein [Mycobacterium sp.]
MNNTLRAAVAAAAVAVVALASAGPTSADNSNSNTNTNDVTNLGGGGAGATSGTESTNWPPTDLSWPPSNVMNGDLASKDKGNSEPTQIVMPLGQPAPTMTATPTTTETTKPIVPAGTP